jgi:hypothetical protein
LVGIDAISDGKHGGGCVVSVCRGPEFEG